MTMASQRTFPCPGCLDPHDCYENGCVDLGDQRDSSRIASSTEDEARRESFNAKAALDAADSGEAET